MLFKNVTTFLQGIAYSGNSSLSPHLGFQIPLLVFFDLVSELLKSYLVGNNDHVQCAPNEAKVLLGVISPF